MVMVEKLAKEWINTAETLVHEEFECSYSILDIKNDADTKMDEEPAGSRDVNSSTVCSISFFFTNIMFFPEQEYL
jgi:hypothetical protein